MIILDTNILVGTSLRSSSADLLRTIRAAGVERVAVPSVVMEELAAQQAITYKAKHEGAARAVRDLVRAAPWHGKTLNVGDCDLERVRTNWKARFGEVAEVIPTSEAALREAMYREANLLAPCKTVNSGKNKTGARDAAIWMTAVEYARDHPAETVYFVSANTDDFGDGKTYPPGLAEDVAEFGHRFVLLTALDEVVDIFAKPTTADDRQMMTALSATEVRDAVAREFMAGKWFQGFGPTAFACTLRTTANAVAIATARDWAATPDVDLGAMTDVNAHSIGEHVWCTATVRWILTGVGWHDEYKIAPMACAWETSVLLSPTNTDAGITILRSNRVEAATEQEFKTHDTFRPPRNLNPADLDQLRSVSLPPSPLSRTEQTLLRILPALQHWMDLNNASRNDTD